MEYRALGNSDIKVSQLCLGTMTFGCQNTQAQSHAQLQLAVEHGINFIDTAELYPAPVSAETTFLTETIIGNWLRHQPRDQLVIATKVVGPAPKKWIGHIRGGPQLTDAQIMQAVDDSLQRLNTDYIDLYQIHWPARKTNYFGKLGYEAGRDKHDSPIVETVATLANLIKSGKIRAAGVSNETSWGLHSYLNAATQLGVDNIVSVQNPYCLLNRTFEIGLAEFAHRDAIGLLAYSPLAGGALSGKYLGNQKPPGARLTRYENYFYRYTTDAAANAVSAYVDIARRHDLEPAAMALAFVR
ncbi:MAG: aldo/keto reductase, partial [Pseudomonadota bacterium]